MRSPIPRLVALAIRRPWVTLAIAALLTALALVVAVDRFVMTTDTAALISPRSTGASASGRSRRRFPN